MKIVGEDVTFTVSDVMQLSPDVPPYIVVKHLPHRGPRQLYTLFRAEGLQDLISELKTKLALMEGWNT
jgi:hypothetical protein